MEGEGEKGRRKEEGRKEGMKKKKERRFFTETTQVDVLYHPGPRTPLYTQLPGLGSELSA